MIKSATVTANEQTKSNNDCDENESIGPVQHAPSSTDSLLYLPIPSSFVNIDTTTIATTGAPSPAGLEPSAIQLNESQNDTTNHKRSILSVLNDETHGIPKIESWKRCKLSVATNSYPQRETLHMMKDYHDTDTVPAGTASTACTKGTTVEDRVRARAQRQLQSQPPPNSMPLNDNMDQIQTTHHPFVDSDLLLRVADGIWSYATTTNFANKHRTYNSSPKEEVPNRPLSAKQSLNISTNYQTFVLKDIVRLLRSTAMTYVGRTTKVMKSNTAVQNKLSKRQIAEAMIELSTDRYYNWITFIDPTHSLFEQDHKAAKPLGPPEVPVNTKGTISSLQPQVANPQQQQLLLIQNLSSNTIVHINHSVNYTKIRKQIERCSI
jgi:hypothetical protein